MDKKMKKRIAMAVLGQCACGVSAGFFKMAALGVDPFLSFVGGLDCLVPISFGAIWIVINAVLLLFTFCADRHYIGLGTLVSLFLLGYIAQYTLAGLQYLFPHPSLALRFGLLLAGIVATCISAAFYYTADMGVSSYDSVALILANRWHAASFKTCRMLCDLACVVLGASFYLLSGGKLSSLPAITGLGTVIAALFIGPLIEVFKTRMAIPFLER